MDISKTLNEINTIDGKSLGELSSQSPLLVVFLRHAGCIFCSETLKKLSDLQTDLSKFQIILVCLGIPEKIESLAQSWGLKSFKVVFDPEKALYKAIGLRRGNLLKVLGPSIIFSAIKAYFNGHRLGKLAGDAFQLPGTAIISKGNVIKAHLAENAAEQTDFQEFCSI